MTLFPGSIYGGVAQLGASAKAAAIPWYLAGGIAAVNCIAAYQPKGAADLAASYINLANPGTYNAAPGTAPTWDAVNGWIFDGVSQYLNTSVQPSSGWTQIIRFSNGVTTATSRALMGFFKTNNFHMRSAWDGDNYHLYIYGNKTVYSASRLASGIMAQAGEACYLNGTADGMAAGSSWVAGETANIFIGARNGSGNPQFHFVGYVQCAAIYNTTLTAPQVAALSAAMAAL